MSKNSKRIPPALKHGIYSGLGVLPTESRAKFRKFRKQMFADLNLIGRVEQDIGEEIVGLEWRRQNLSTYDLARRACARRSAIHSRVPWLRYLDPLALPEPTPHPDNPSPEVIEAARKRADKQIQTELGGAIELVELGEVATLDYLEKRLAILERLDEMITRAYKKLAYVRAIKSMSPAIPAAPKLNLPLLESRAN